MKPVLTDREMDIMAVLWQHGPCTVTDVRSRLRDDLAHNTVHTMLRILEDKGYVARRREGRAHVYRARVSSESARREALSWLRRKLFEGSASLMVTQLLRERKLSLAEIERLRGILEEHESAGGE